MASHLRSSATFRPRLRRGSFVPGQFRVFENTRSSESADTDYSPITQRTCRLYYARIVLKNHRKDIFRIEKAKNKHKLDFDRLWKRVTVSVSRNSSGAESVDAESNVTRHRTSSIGTRKSNLSVDRVASFLSLSPLENSIAIDELRTSIVIYMLSFCNDKVSGNTILEFLPSKLPETRTSRRRNARADSLSKQIPDFFRNKRVSTRTAATTRDSRFNLTDEQSYRTHRAVFHALSRLLPAMHTRLECLASAYWHRRGQDAKRRKGTMLTDATRHRTTCRIMHGIR